MSYTIVREPKLDELVTANRSRAVGAGIDPNQYEQVTSRLMTVGEWTPAFRAAALEHRERADAARDAERHVSAGERRSASSIPLRFGSSGALPALRSWVSCVDPAAYRNHRSR